MGRILPFVLAAVAVIALTLVEGLKTGRWVDLDRRTAYCASLLTQIPDRVGDWVGEDSTVEENILTTAGADGYISRNFQNLTSGERVNVWLIVGHAHDIAEHTPDSCYPSQGASQRAPHENYTISIEGQPDAVFWTAVFDPKNAAVPSARVFWSWFQPETEGELRWIAPSGPRWAFGNAPTLYKMYFTANAGKDEKPQDNSVCVEFAKEFMPAIRPILEQATRPTPDSFDPTATTSAATTEAADDADLSDDDAT
ncbi:exosortase-associated EpsI family protein [Botrimarina hoheduenensis]|uniref:Methanolan biosynthesis EpsI domain-containing protein n=1 Tax=Botrimarina hoheduenensis TaxID=2528000 RepID=A0A5C5WB74_9BACT|nr:exosortase-associated EpsI family protein [Botrimarina hoheduenensis]TWT47261.1 hypothetical protein Pla111_08740 [Botrimarina hoheduenensis]